MSDKTDIRLFTQQDKTAWLSLWQGYQNFYKTSISNDVSETNWQRLLNPDEPMNGAMAFFDGKAAGFVHYIRHRSTWTTGDYCYLQDLFVDPTIRGQGLGRALIRHVYGAAQADGCSRVYWLTHESNSDAMILYDRVAEKSGFIQYRKLL